MRVTDSPARNLLSFLPAEGWSSDVKHYRVLTASGFPFRFPTGWIPFSLVSCRTASDIVVDILAVLVFSYVYVDASVLNDIKMHSSKRVVMKTIEDVLHLYRAKCFEFNVHHFRRCCELHSVGLN